MKTQTNVAPRGILLLLLCLVVGSMAAEPWPAARFAEVRAYAWPTKMIDHVILPGMKLREGALNPNGTVLKADQVKRLQKAITIESERQLPAAGCHIPHNAFVFYDAAGKPVAYLEVCFGCGSQASGPRPRKGHVHLNFMAAAVMFEEMKLPLGFYRNLDAFKKGEQTPLEK
jgi:hypothetical protein